MKMIDMLFAEAATAATLKFLASGLVIPAIGICVLTVILLRAD